MTSIYKDAGNRVYLMRKNRGYSREYLAEKASISIKFLYEIETGKTGFSAAVLYNLCKALDVDCDYILTGQVRKGYSEQLEEALRLFSSEQCEEIAVILKKIYEMI